jgi:hypothetical protein
MTAFTRYIEELQSYEKVLDYLREAVLTVSPVVSDGVMLLKHGSTATWNLISFSFGLTGLALARSLRRQYLWEKSFPSPTFYNCICLGSTCDLGFQYVSVVSCVFGWVGFSGLQ